MLYQLSYSSKCEGLAGLYYRVSFTWVMTPPGVDQIFSSTTAPLNYAQGVLAVGGGVDPHAIPGTTCFQDKVQRRPQSPTILAKREGLEPTRRYSRLLPTFQIGALPIRLTSPYLASLRGFEPLDSLRYLLQYCRCTSLIYSLPS